MAASGSSSIGMSPRVHPRPDYGMVKHEVLRFTATELFRLPALCTLVTVLTRPMYSAAFHSTAWREWWAWAESAPLIPLPGWVTANDLFFTLGLWLSLTSVFILCHGIFGSLDYFGLCAKYKVPRKPAQVPSITLVRAALLEQAFNHLIMAPIMMLLFVGPLLRLRNPTGVVPENLPSIDRVGLTFVVCYTLNEIMFYFAHRLLHSKKLYAGIHKQHHSFVGTISIAAEHAHPIEDALSAYLPFLAGVVLMGAHFHIVFVWFFVRLTEVYEAHSGYLFRGSLLDRVWLSSGINSVCHDFHHTGNRGNFGHPLLDWCFGTMDAWVANGGATGYVNQGIKRQ
eukprot:m.111876 g.111876  ORF g.111876 m.111876 type:complete len:340 (+) comp21386_c0_seq3:84-1103(+)